VENSKHNLIHVVEALQSIILAYELAI